MNVLILTTETAEALIANQDGQHRLGPVALTDGRYFLMADVLDEPLHANRCGCLEYTVSSFESIADLIPIAEIE